MNFRHREPDVSPSGGGGPVILDKPLPVPDHQRIVFGRLGPVGAGPKGYRDRADLVMNQTSPAYLESVREAVEAQRNIERRAVFDSRKRYVERWA